MTSPRGTPPSRRSLRTIVVLALIVTAFSAATAQPDESTADGSPRAITIMTYNIERGHHRRDAFRNIRDLIVRTAPDVLCLQEVTWRDRAEGPSSAQLPLLAKSLGEYEWCVASRSATTGPALLLRGRIKRHEPLAVTSRSPYGVLAEVEIDGRSLVVVSLHLRSLRGATLSGAMTTEPDRVAQVRDLMKRLDGETRPVIIAGDFNALPLFPSCVLLATKFHDTAARFKDTSHTRETRRYPARIDYVFLSDQWKATSYNVLPVDHSDHRPVVVTARPASPTPAK